MNMTQSVNNILLVPLEKQLEPPPWKMQITQTIRCPNCGSHAERHHLVDPQQTRTECPACDYLMITCSRTGSVVEAYAPGYWV